MSDICMAIIIPAMFTGCFVAMGIMARRDRKEMELLEARIGKLDCCTSIQSHVRNCPICDKAIHDGSRIV